MGRQIRDLSRARKTYSFYRTQPRLTTVESEVMYKFNDIGEMSALNVLSIESGELVYVKSIRDYFVLEKEINLGSTNNIDQVSAQGGQGVWYRLGLGYQYWNNQTEWYIDSNNGNDENLGTVDSPLATHDELSRRLLTDPITSDYIVNIVTNSAIVGQYGCDISLNGGSITYKGETYTSTSVGTATVLQPQIDYSTTQIPAVQGASLTGTEDLLYIDNEFLGWNLDGSAGVITTTEQKSGSVSDSLQSVTLPSWTPGIISLRGSGDVYIEDTIINCNDVVLDPGTELVFRRSKLTGSVKFYGGTTELDHSVINSGVDNIELGANSTVVLSGSGIKTTGIVDIKRDSTVEMGATSIFAESVDIHSSKLIMALEGSTGCALSGCYLNVGSDSIVDVRNMFKAGSEPYPVRLIGTEATIFYDTVNVPKADNISINNGITGSLSWASDVPYNDVLRDFKIVSGNLKNS